VTGQLGPERISELIAVANLQVNNVTECERIAAIEILLSEYRTEVDQYKSGVIGEVDRLLSQSIENWALQIFAQPDPVAALAVFLGRKRQRGKRAKNIDRDFEIAVEVAKMMFDGETLDNASAAVAERLIERGIKISAERVENIYKANRVEAKADEAMRRL
jgi:hypothetical protein